MASVADSTTIVTVRPVRPCLAPLGGPPSSIRTSFPYEFVVLHFRAPRGERHGARSVQPEEPAWPGSHSARPPPSGARSTRACVTRRPAAFRARSALARGCRSKFHPIEHIRLPSGRSTAAQLEGGYFGIGSSEARLPGSRVAGDVERWRRLRRRRLGGVEG